MGNIYITGDIHGSATDIRQKISQISSPNKDDIIIVCGDAGFEYTDDCITNSAKKMAMKFPGSWIILRGNHDSRYWRDHAILDFNINEKLKITPDNGWSLTDDQYFLYQNKYPNIKYVRDDGGIYNINGYNFLFIPGAYSVDKYYRLNFRYPYEPEEQLSQQEQLRLLNLIDAYNNINKSIDFIIGHTFPLSLEPYYQYLFLDFIDQSIVDKQTEVFLEKAKQKFEKNKAFKHYFGGHFHDDKQLAEKYTMLYHNIINIKDYI